MFAVLSVSSKSSLEQKFRKMSSFHSPIYYICLYAVNKQHLPKIKGMTNCVYVLQFLSQSTVINE